MTVQLSRCLYFRLRASQHLTRIGVFPLQFFTSLKKKAFEPYNYNFKKSMYAFLLFCRGPYLEQRGTEGLKQEWFTKYFSF